MGSVSGLNTGTGGTFGFSFDVDLITGSISNGRVDYSATIGFGPNPGTYLANLIGGTGSATDTGFLMTANTGTAIWSGGAVTATGTVNNWLGDVDLFSIQNNHTFNSRVGVVFSNGWNDANGVDSTFTRP